MNKVVEIYESLVNKFLQSPKSFTTLALFGTVVVLFTGSQLRKWLWMRSYFKKLGIPGPTPLPVVGNLHLLIKYGLSGADVKLREEYGRIVGYFEGSRPVILCSDPQMLKAIMMKDFASFPNRRHLDDLMSYPVDKFMTSLRDDEWKNVRSICSSTFTSGKLRMMSPCIIACADNYMKHLDKNIFAKDAYFDVKEFFGSYTLDTICSCCFGIDVDSINNPQNDFLKHLKIIFGQVFTNPLMLIFLLAPSLGKFLVRHKLASFFKMDSILFLQHAVNEIIRRRKANEEKREDFIQYILEHEQEANAAVGEEKLKKTLTTDEVTAQAILFIVAGYDTTANSLGFLAYNLAKNPDIQERLCHEIDEALENHNNVIDYDLVNNLEYLDMCINENLRIFPPALRTDRQSSQEYVYNGIRLPKGTIVSPCIWSLHYDPEYYPEPERYDPERFSEQGKKTRPNEAFIPFSTGPRICIGMRFALLETKILITKILSKYKFVVCDKTSEKIVMKSTGLANPKEPIIIKLQKRY